MRFVKKPVEIDAEQLTWTNWGAVCDLVGSFSEQGVVGGVREDDGTYTWGEDADPIAVGGDSKPIAVKIATLEGEMVGDEGDWIIKGVKGEFYPCKPDIFEMSYDPVAA